MENEELNLLEDNGWIFRKRVACARFHSDQIFDKELMRPRGKFFEVFVGDKERNLPEDPVQVFEVFVCEKELNLQEDFVCCFFCLGNEGIFRETVFKLRHI